MATPATSAPPADTAAGMGSEMPPPAADISAESHDAPDVSTVGAEATYPTEEVFPVPFAVGDTTLSEPPPGTPADGAELPPPRATGMGGRRPKPSARTRHSIREKGSTLIKLRACRCCGDDEAAAFAHAMD
ncbi:unnamed protein product [Polarella glacialis]|uniref:Uncharacterized protein n=1 Tax=Polarella glacialis TaxID=89957 RepID=A0A813KKB5_POLGL|nr:unnamed protein product [Polarella glacialis]